MSWWWTKECGNISESCVWLLLLLMYFFINSFLWTDIGECTEEPAICGPHSNCTNSIGSYTCVCHKGYRLNNFDVIASVTNPCTGACSLVCYACRKMCCTTGAYVVTSRSDNPLEHKVLPCVLFPPYRYWWVLWATRHMWPKHRVHQCARNFLLFLSWWTFPLHRNLLDSWDLVLSK